MFLQVDKLQSYPRRVFAIQLPAQPECEPRHERIQRKGKVVQRVVGAPGRGGPMLIRHCVNEVAFSGEQRGEMR